MMQDAINTQISIMQQSYQDVLLSYQASKMPLSDRPKHAPNKISKSYFTLLFITQNLLLMLPKCSRCGIIQIDKSINFLSRQMTKGQSPTPLLLILLLLTSQTHQTQTFAVHHRPEPQHLTSSLQQSHQSSYVIYHNMRNLHFGYKHHALHLSTSSQTHGINSMGYFFTINMTVEGIPYSLNIDTGSSDIFIKGQDSKGKPDKKYSCPVCKKKNQQMSVSYLDGTLYTYLKEAKIQFGKHSFKEHILVAYYAPKNFEVPQGLVGLSFPSLARNPHPTFIQTLINNKIINRYAFGVNLNFQNNKTSSITFGEPDTSKFEGKLLKVPIMSIHSYVIKIDSIQIANGVHFALAQALLDTGNSCISIPKRFAGLILQQFNRGPNRCGFNKEPFAPMFSLLRCAVKNFQVLPTVNIYINSKKFEVDKHAYTQRCVQEGEVALCDFYIESMTGQSQVLIGDGFFNRYYTYFDIQGKEIGLAKNKENLSYKNMFKPANEFDKQDMEFFNDLKKRL